jgi:hypothetical protein
MRAAIFSSLAVIGALLGIGSAGAKVIKIEVKVETAPQKDKEPVKENEPEAVQKAKVQLAEQLAKLKATHGQVLWLNAPVLAKEFPSDVFLAVRFRQFPVARVLPEGLSASNVFVVTKDGKVERLGDVKALTEFFGKNLPRVKKDADAGPVVSAWLALAQELKQDGFFKFEILDKETEAAKADGGVKVTGRAIVKQGGNGDLRVTLVFDADGKLTKAEEEAKIRPGPRPICQATKLLDPDPVVRRIVEQDLLIMGLAARDYLEEQRARANPELQRAIDRLWQRMVENGW